MLFRRNALSKRVSFPPDAFYCQHPEALLRRHHGLLNEIRRNVGIPETHYEALYMAIFRQFAAYMQELPASEAHHHASPGGALRHGLEVACHAVRRRRKLLLPAGATAEQIAERQDLWTYAIVTAALLHDIGKPVVDLEVLMLDPQGLNMGAWQPWRGDMPSQGCHAYRTRYRRGRTYRLHERMPAFFIKQLMPSTGIEWLARDPEAFALWSALLVGDWDNAGIIGQIVQEADGQSVADDLAGEHRKMPGIRQRPLHERLVTGLRYLIDQGTLPLNSRGAAGWIHGGSLWMVSKRTLDALREHLEQEGHGGIPQRNDRLMDALQQSGCLISCEDRAIWKVNVFAEGWPRANPLTVLRFPLGKIWNDPSAIPGSFDGTVTPEDQPAESRPEDHPVDVDAGRATPGPPPPEETDNTAPRPGNRAKGATSDEEGTRGPQDGQDIFSMPANGKSNAEPAGGTDPATDAADREEPEPPPPSESAGRFLTWLRDNLKKGLLETNTPSGRIHRVQEGLLLVSPGIFKDYRDPNPEVTWQQVQRRFARLKLHQKMTDGTNIHPYDVIGAKSRKRSVIKGFLLPEAGLQEIFPDCILPEPNPHLRKKSREPGDEQEEPEKHHEEQPTNIKEIKQ